jgi:hypothetical protein
MEIEEVVAHVALYATIKTIFRLSCVNKFYEKIFNNYHFWWQKSIFDNFVIPSQYPLGSWKDEYIMFYLHKTCAHKYKSGIRCDNRQITNSFFCKTCDERRCTFLFKAHNIMCSNICDDIGQYCEICKLRNCKYVFKRGKNKGDKCENICLVNNTICNKHDACNS